MSPPTTRSHTRLGQDAPNDNPKTTVAQFHLRMVKDVLGEIEGERDVGSVLQYISAAEELLFDSSRPVGRQFNWLTF